MPLKIKPKPECRWDLVSLGEVMLRLDPGEGRVDTTRTFRVWEGGGEYNVARGLRRCFGLDTAHVTALVDNPVSRAPGFCVENVYVFAGIPAIMQAMFEGITHELTGSNPVLSRTVSAYLAEGVVARGLGALQAQYPDVEIGSYPFYQINRFGTSIVLRSTDKARLDQATEAYKQIVRELGEEPIEGEIH